MEKRILNMKRILLTFLLTIGLTASSYAVPNLQIYIPGATYDDVAETWVTTETDFEIWILAANLSHGDIFDVTLVAAILGDEAPIDGGLTITPDGGSVITYNAADFTFGTPPVSDPIPAHGIYPSNYVQLLVASVTEQDPNNWVEVQDYIPDSDGGSNIYGQIFKFQVHTEYIGTHFDAYGFYDDEQGRRVFAPFSHDGASIIPEPTTALLFTLGLAGAGIVSRFRII